MSLLQTSLFQFSNAFTRHGHSIVSGIRSFCNFNQFSSENVKKPAAAKYFLPDNYVTLVVIYFIIVNLSIPNMKSCMRILYFILTSFHQQALTILTYFRIFCHMVSPHPFHDIFAGKLVELGRIIHMTTSIKCRKYLYLNKQPWFTVKNPRALLVKIFHVISVYLWLTCTTVQL